MTDLPAFAPLGDTAVAPSVAAAATDPERARIAEGTADQPGRWWAFELPTGSGRLAHLGTVADDLERRLLRLFLPDGAGRRPIWGSSPLFQEDPAWRDELLFHEYFHGETGEGLGASHQTGWTALVTALVADRARRIHRGRELR